MEYINIQDVKNVSNIISIDTYISHCLGIEVKYNRISCPLCQGNRNDKASTKTGKLVCFSCGFKGDSVELHKAINKHSDIYSATRDLMQIFSINNLSSYNKNDIKVLEKNRNSNIEFRNKSLKAFEQLRTECIKIFSSDSYTEVVKDYMCNLSIEVVEILKLIESKSIFSEEEKANLRKKYSFIKNEMIGGQ